MKNVQVEDRFSARSGKALAVLRKPVGVTLLVLMDLWLRGCVYFCNRVLLPGGVAWRCSRIQRLCGVCAIVEPVFNLGTGVVEAACNLGCGRTSPIGT